jgi:pyruvate-formate lyase
LTINFHPTAVAGEDGLRNFEMLLKTFFAMGGIQLQTNILNVEILRIAQREPERYRDLVIRVWGFSAYFVELSRQYQDEVIARTAHTI